MSDRSSGLEGYPFSSNAGLDPFFYKKSCPQVHFIVFRVVEKVSRTDTRMPASLVRLFFHDCFVQAHGPFLKFPLGRRDSLTANRTLANENLPAPFFNLTQLKAAFAVQGLDTTDLVALSANKCSPIQIYPISAHCLFILDRLYNFSGTGRPDPTLDTTYNNCAKYAPKVKKGLLQSDQELFSTPGADTIPIVNKFSGDQIAFLKLQ
ncbi:Peroxidase 22 [Glycine soja]